MYSFHAVLIHSRQCPDNYNSSNTSENYTYYVHAKYYNYKLQEWYNVTRENLLVLTNNYLLFFIIFFLYRAQLYLSILSEMHA